jgi:MFS family permease
MRLKRRRLNAVTAQRRRPIVTARCIGSKTASHVDRTTPGLRALEALNFFMADVQAGIGPFLGVLLQARGWQTGAIGWVMTLGGITGLVATGPAGAWVDASCRKRTGVVVGCILTVLTTALLWGAHSFAMVAASQVAAAFAGAALGPAVTGITLGMVGQADFGRQFGRNQVANHAGNVVGATLSGYLGWRFGFAAVFVLAAAFGVLSIVSVLRIPRSAIDDRMARGLEQCNAGAPSVSTVRTLLSCRPLLILALSLALFHLGNAAMLPLYGLAVVAAHEGDPAIFTAETLVVAQGVMVFASLAAIRWLRTRGYWWVMLLTFSALPVRGLLAASIIKSWGVWPVQVLDGIGAGLQSVAVPALVARLMQGTGRVNVGQGAVMTVQGIGASLSPALGGVIAQGFGYRTAFLCLGGIALASLALWLGFAPVLKQADSGSAASGRCSPQPAPSPQP